VGVATTTKKKVLVVVVVVEPQLPTNDLVQIRGRNRWSLFLLGLRRRRRKKDRLGFVGCSRGFGDSLETRRVEGRERRGKRERRRRRREVSDVGKERKKRDGDRDVVRTHPSSYAQSNHK